MITLGHMHRMLVLVSLGLLGACDVGSVLAHSGDGGGGDTGGGGGSDCPALATPETNTGHHAANGATGDTGATTITAHEGCQANAGCHGTAPGAGGAYDYGGEAFSDATGTTPAAGQTILLGAGTQYTTMEVNANGFFYLAPNTGFPAPGSADITAWLCIGSVKSAMLIPIATGDGNCSLSGGACHGPSGNTGGFIYPTTAGS